MAYVGAAPGQEAADIDAARYLAERYAWATMLIDIVSDLGRAQYLPPALWEAWDAAVVRASGATGSDAAIDDQAWIASCQVVEKPPRAVGVVLRGLILQL